MSTPSAKESLFVITSRQDFGAEVRLAAPAAGIQIAGRAALPAAAAAAACAEALGSGATAVLIDLDSETAEGLAALREVGRRCPGVRALVASSAREPELILQAMRAGATDFLSLPLDPMALAESLARTTSRAAVEAAPTGHRGRVISFLGAKGGCGATTVAVNVAVGVCRSAAESRRSVVLLDLDAPGGDVAAMLKLEQAYSLTDVAASLHRLDMDLLSSMSMRHDSGLICLGAAGDAGKPAAAAAPDPDQMTGIVSFLRDHFDLVVLAGGSLGEADMAAVNQAHLVHMVTTLDFLALRRAQGMIGRLREYGVTGDSLRVIVNRVERGADLSVSDAHQALDAAVACSIPDDPRAAQQAVNEGVPAVAAGKGRLQAALQEYAARIAGGEVGQATGGFGSLFKRLVPGRIGASA